LIWEQLVPKTWKCNCWYNNGWKHEKSWCSKKSHSIYDDNCFTYITSNYFELVCAWFFKLLLTKSYTCRSASAYCIILHFASEFIIQIQAYSWTNFDCELLEQAKFSLAQAIRQPLCLIIGGNLVPSFTHFKWKLVLSKLR
jgi:hypothetical protein